MAKGKVRRSSPRTRCSTGTRWRGPGSLSVDMCTSTKRTAKRRHCGNYVTMDAGGESRANRRSAPDAVAQVQDPLRGLRLVAGGQAADQLEVDAREVVEERPPPP